MKKQELPFALIAVDLCVFKIIDGKLCVYIRDVEKDSLYQGMKCLPGGLILLKESAEDTVARILKNKTDLELGKIYTEQLYTFSKINRDKRSRVLSCSYLVLYTGDNTEGFVDIKNLKKLAYDHNEIVTIARDRLKSKIGYTTVVKKILPEDFTYSELQKAYEIILGKSIDKRNFRKKIDKLNVIVDTKKKRQDKKMRPASVYKFKSKNIDTLKILD